MSAMLHSKYQTRVQSAYLHDRCLAKLGLHQPPRILDANSCDFPPESNRTLYSQDNMRNLFSQDLAPREKCPLLNCIFLCTQSTSRSFFRAQGRRPSPNDKTSPRHVPLRRLVFLKRKTAQAELSSGGSASCRSTLSGTCKTA